MGLSHTISGIDSDFSRKSQNFPTPLYFAPPLKGFSLELGISTRDQITRMGLAGRQRSLMTSSAIWIECTNVMDGWTDRQTHTGSQQRPCLRIVSRGKNSSDFIKSFSNCHVNGQKLQTMDKKFPW